MKPQDWRYEGEGRKHVVFSYHPSASPPTELKGCLLRLEKKDIVESTSMLHPVMRIVDEDAGDCLFYMREMVQSKLPAYIDLPRVVELNSSFACELGKRAVGHISKGRQEDWKMARHKKDGHPKNRFLRGQLLLDYRLWHCPAEPPTELGTVSFEIKPKAGYLTTSPLVHPKRRSKYQIARFQLFQHLAREKRIVKPCMTRKNSLETSKYNPLDLYSGQRGRIRRAVYQLTKCPQNNLKVWKGREVVLDASIVHTIDWSSVLQRLGMQVDVETTQASSRDLVVDLVSSVLESESCLSFLLELQKLDILDGDGAVLVYERLVHICRGSHADAMALLDADPDLPNEQRHSMIGGSPFDVSGECSNLHDLVRRVNELSAVLGSSSPSLPSDFMDATRHEALLLVDNLSLPECVYLLQNWLLSLSMCDVSLFVTFHITNEPKGTQLTNRRTENGRLRVLRVQSGETAGILDVPWPGILHYRMKLIDFDKKPAHKLQRRLQKEECLDGIAVNDCGGHCDKRS